MPYEKWIKVQISEHRGRRRAMLSYLGEEEDAKTAGWVQYDKWKVFTNFHVSVTFWISFLKLKQMLLQLKFKGVITDAFLSSFGITQDIKHATEALQHLCVFLNRRHNYLYDKCLKCYKHYNNHGLGIWEPSRSSKDSLVVFFPPLIGKKMKAKGINESNTHSSKYEHYARERWEQEWKLISKGTVFKR